MLLSLIHISHHLLHSKYDTVVHSYLLHLYFELPFSTLLFLYLFYSSTGFFSVVFIQSTTVAKILIAIIRIAYPIDTWIPSADTTMPVTIGVKISEAPLAVATRELATLILLYPILVAIVTITLNSTCLLYTSRCV